MDVEDPVNPRADDAALDFAEVFTKAGVRGSFCLTGEKCRTLLERGRHDVIDAFRPHCLGLHTNTHSYHPTTMELLADVSYEHGCALALKSERIGLDIFSCAFQRTPAFWGGAGNTWSPEICAALTNLDIPAYSYAQTSLPNHAVHYFNGCTALPQAISISEDEWAYGFIQVQSAQRFLAEFTGPWVGLFVGHPTRFRYQEFWDHSLAAGVTPPVILPSDLQDETTYHECLDRLYGFLIDLKAKYEIVGVDEFLSQDLEFREPTESEREHFRIQTAKNLRAAKHWPIHRPDLDVEGIVSKTLNLESTLMVLI